MPISMKAQEVRKRVHSSMVSASEAIRWVRLSSLVSGSCRDSFSSCSSRAWRSLLTRTMPSERVGADRAQWLDQLRELGAACERACGNLGEDRRRIVAPGERVGRKVPGETGLAERGEDAGSWRDRGHQACLDLGHHAG